MFSYKTLFWYSVSVIALLLIAVPVFANTIPATNLLDFSRSNEVGQTMQAAQTLSKGINISHLGPGEENWFVYSQNGFNDPNFSWVSLALRYSSEAQILPHEVNFEVFAQKSAGTWFQTEQSPEQTLGTGITSPLRTAHNLIETFWTGQVEPEEQYFVRVYNNSPFSLDYTLEAKAEKAAVSGATPASFNASAGNAAPANTRQMAWTLTAQAVASMDASAAATWMQQAQTVGWLVTAATDSTAAPDPARANPQLLWQLTAQAIAGQSADDAARWLLQADSMGWLAIPLTVPVRPPADAAASNGGGGDPGGDTSAAVDAMPAPPIDVYTPVSVYPNNPLPFDLNNVNSGRLAPYGEHWYLLNRDDMDKDLVENMKLTMFFTPIQGFVSNRVNFEIFPASQYHIWARGDTNYMESFGVGMWVSRDKDPDTGERLWNGTLVDGDNYLVKVKNGTPKEVDYYLYPNDVENAELGNPTLIRGDGTSSPMTYAASPPTRSIEP
jgi:hypothetical protein